jgi:hypothetical protein
MLKLSEGLEYAVDVTVSYCLVNGIGSCKDTELVIPSEYNGLPVVGIAGNAFRSCRDIKKIILSDGLRMICSSAFYGCEGLCDVYLPDSIISIGHMAFCECTSLRSIRIPKKAEHIGGCAFRSCPRLECISYSGKRSEWQKICTDYSWDEDTGAYTVFCTDGSIKKLSSRCMLLDKMTKDGHRKTLPYVNRTISKGLEYSQNDDGTLAVAGIGSCTDTNLCIPASVDGLPVTRIEKKAFKDCKDIESVSIPFGVEVIQSSAFYGCKRISHVTIPNSVYVIENAAFANCERLSEISIPNTVQHIASHTFTGCRSLKCAEIPDSAESIGMSAFEGCCKLESVKLPSALSYVDINAFKGCDSLTRVFYPKSTDEWEICVTDRSDIGKLIKSSHKAASPK